MEEKTGKQEGSGGVRRNRVTAAEGWDRKE